ncbi:MAG: hypothetical protein CME21_10605 [Gemmatimonadetes bacterium]|nr:hypothetical protein [Gemmatimonadota bacterium]
MKPTFCPRKFASATLILTALWLITSQAASQQTIGVPTQVSLPSGSGTLTLDFTSSDYQLILYSALRDEPDTSRTYDFTVGAAFATRPSVRLFQHASGVRTSVKARLRSEEAELAKRFRLSGFPAARKQAVAFQVGSARTFTFESFGSVRTQNVSATLVATSSRAEAWVDNNTSLITTAEAQAQIDRFSDHAYPIITSAFGGMSDVDGNGKVIFLYTELVDQIGGVAGFFRAKSLYSTFDGGDGNEADMMYIGLDHEDSFFESLLAHEFQHLVNYNQHVRLRNGPSEISPINEALSHIAEDLVGQHVEGGNPGNVKTYAEAPGLYSILAEKAHDSGVRGTAYTFARSMMESFGDDVPRRLTQTDLSGIANVENVSAKTFEEVYEMYLSRMFLAGSGLNSRYDYAYPFFVDPTTGGRSIPVPDHHALSPDAVTVTGSTKAYAAASIRLMGTEVSTISIDTDASGQFRGLLIPIPTLFRHNAALKTDYFTGITFDTSLSGHFTTGENVRISGSIADPATTEILFRFDPQDTAADTLRYSVDGLTGRFDLPVVLPHEAAGRYTLSIFAGVQDQSLPFFGRLPGVTIARGTGAVELPMDYFSAITLDATLPTELTAGSNVLVSGFVSDPTTVDRLLFRFDPLNGGDTVRIFSDVEEGRFDATFFVHPTLSGTFRIKVFAGLAADPTLGFTGDYGPFRWLDLGGVFSIPSTFFSGVSLTKDLPGILRAGEGITLAGTVSDRSVTQILFQFEPRGGAVTTCATSSTSLGAASKKESSSHRRKAENTTSPSSRVKRGSPSPL